MRTGRRTHDDLVDVHFGWLSDGEGDGIGDRRGGNGNGPVFTHEKLSALVGELSIRSVEFRSWWSKHNVERRTTGTKSYHHPLVGDLTVKYQALNPSSGPSQF